jgi:hypothetical protein
MVKREYQIFMGCEESFIIMKLHWHLRSVRLAYQQPASSIFLSKQINHQQPLLFSQNNPAPAISHQPNKQTANFQFR